MPMQNNELRGIREHLAAAENPEKVVEFAARDGTSKLPRDQPAKKLPTLIGSKANTNELLDLPPPRFPARLIPDST
jgi:hypothetical protein